MDRREALRLLRGAAVSCPAAVLPRRLAAQDAPASTEYPSQFFGAEFDAASRITVPVHIAGRGPFTFLVDTASERTVIARELARELNLRAGPPVGVHTLSGRVEGETALLLGMDVLARFDQVGLNFARRTVRFLWS